MLVLLGHDQVGSPAGLAGAETALADLLAGLSRNAAGGVAGSAEALAGLRGTTSTDAVTTVDGVDTVAGQVTTVLALVRSPAERRWGLRGGGEDGAVPLG